MQFTSTETCRPELMRRSLESIIRNVRGADLADSTLFINIDPAPEGACPCDVIEVAECFFGEVIANKPAVPNFAAAFRWCMVQPTDPIFFHFEFDWIVAVPIDIKLYVHWLYSDPGLSCVNLRAYGGIHDERICLSPGIWRRDHARVIAGRMDDDRDPELQLRGAGCTPGGAASGYRGVQFPEIGGSVIRDIGRAWLAEHGLRKNMGNRLTRWEAA